LIARRSAKLIGECAQRGYSREPVFFEEGDYLAYLGWLAEASARYGCAIQAYALMTNHMHLLVTPRKTDSVGRLMQYVGRRYVPYINHTYGTSGTLWEGRYKASLAQEDRYLLTCMRYIELNPVRAGMVKSPAHYRFSSYRANGQGRADKRLTPHALYTALGRTVEERCEAYRELFRAHVDPDVLQAIRRAWQTGTPLGNEHFKTKIEQKLKCKVGYAHRGRPVMGRQKEF